MITDREPGRAEVEGGRATDEQAEERQAPAREGEAAAADARDGEGPGLDQGERAGEPGPGAARQAGDEKRKNLTVAVGARLEVIERLQGAEVVHVAIVYKQRSGLPFAGDEGMEVTEVIRLTDRGEPGMPNGYTYSVESVQFLQPAAQGRTFAVGAPSTFIIKPADPKAVRAATRCACCNCSNNSFFWP